jgi:hypothetical protein
MYRGTSNSEAIVELCVIISKTDVSEIDDKAKNCHSMEALRVQIAPTVSYHKL